MRTPPALYLLIDVLFILKTSLTLTHLVAPVEGIPTLGNLESDETLAGDEGTAPGVRRGAPVDRVENSRSQIQIMMMLTPALLCHKDTT